MKTITYACSPSSSLELPLPVHINSRFTLFPLIINPLSSKSIVMAPCGTWNRRKISLSTYGYYFLIVLLIFMDEESIRARQLVIGYRRSTRHSDVDRTFMNVVWRVECNIRILFTNWSQSAVYSERRNISWRWNATSLKIIETLYAVKR